MDGEQEVRFEPTQRLLSRATPPPGTRQWTWGWWVSVCPQVCNTAIRPILAPRRLAARTAERLRRGAHQQAIDGPLVLKGDLGRRRRQGEHDVEIGNRQQFGLAGREPLARAAPWHFGQWRLRQEL